MICIDNKDSNIRVSVIIPSYNTEKYIFRCVNSILSQSVKEIEVIVIDDCSTDSSVAILNSISSSDSRLIVVRNKTNRGQGYSRNVGINIARGKYISFVDSDDMLKQNALDILCTEIEQYELDMVYFNSLRTGNVNITSTHLTCADEEKKTYTGMELFPILYRKGEYPTQVWRIFWRRDFILKIRLYFNESSSPAEDMSFCFRAIMLAQRIRCISHILHVRQYRNDSCVGAGPNLKWLNGFIITLINDTNTLLEIKDKLKFESNELYEALWQYFADIKRRICYYKGFKAFENSSPIVKIMLPSIVNGASFENNVTIHMTYELKTELQSSSCAIVYGVGKAGEATITMLDGYEISDYYVAVSKQDVAKASIYRHDVKVIDDLQFMADKAVVLVAVTNIEFQSEMVINLKRIGLCNYFILDKTGKYKRG